MPETLSIAIGPQRLEGNLCLVTPPRGIVVFAHGSGSSRHSHRNRQVAHALQHSGLGTLLFDLLTEEEALDRANVFDIPLLAQRVVQAIDDLSLHFNLPMGCSAPVRARLLPWWQPRNVPAPCGRSCRAADARTWPWMRWPKSSLPPCSSSAGRTPRFWP